MGVLDYREVSNTSTISDKGERGYTRKYLVRMVNLDDRPPALWSAIPIARNSAYPTDSGAVAISASVDFVELGIYEVTFTYTSKPYDKGNVSGDPTQTDQSTTTPTSRPWVVKFGSTHGTRLLTKDVITGLPVVNSAGQPFDPTVEIPTSNMTISITTYKDFNTFDPIAKILTYQDAINDTATLFVVSPATTTVFPARTLRCTEYNPTSQTENGVTYWQVDLTVEYKKDGWNPIDIVNAGTVYIDSMSKPPQPILDKTGAPISTPIPLDAAGHVLNAGAALVYKSFSGYYERNFGLILT